MKNILSLRELEIELFSGQILEPISLDLAQSSCIILRGKNGSGKSSIAKAIMGFPSPKILGGKLLFDGQDIAKLSIDERAKLGIFMSYQEPIEIPGLSYDEMLREVLLKHNGGPEELLDFKLRSSKILEALSLNAFSAQKPIGKELSGGEKKRMELFQLLMLKPRLAILDEIDSGLDKKGVELFAKIINYCRKTYKTSFIIISHSNRFIEQLDKDAEYELKDKQLYKSDIDSTQV